MASSHSEQERHGRMRQPSNLSLKLNYRSERSRLNCGRPDRCPSAPREGSHLNAGDAIQFFCRSAEDWVDGEVVDVIDDELVRVDYQVGQYWIAKTFRMHSDHLVLPSSTTLCLDESDPMGKLPRESMAFDADLDRNGKMLRNGKMSLATYFANDFHRGIPLDPKDIAWAGYRKIYDDATRQPVFHHEPTDIKVWQFALDFSTSNKRCVAFHYTSQEGFATITHMGNASLAIFRSLSEAGDAYFGEGLYASQREPHEFQSTEAVLCNNYGFKVFLDEKLRKRWGSCARFCLPVIVDEEHYFDVQKRKTPEMTEIGKDKAGNPLQIPEAARIKFQKQRPDLQDKIRYISEHGRDVLVLQIPGKDKVLHAKDNLEDALRHRVNVLKGGKRLHEEQLARSYLGIVCSARAKYDLALEELSEVLRIQIASFGENHPEVAATRNNMGVVYKQQSKHDLALQEYSEALRIQIASFGENHPEVAATRNNMGLVYKQQSKYDLALQEYSEALRISIASFGENHPEVAATRNNMGVVYKQQSKYDLALQEYIEALRIRIASFGENHPEVAATRNNMGVVYKQQSKYDLALQEYSEALRIRIASFGENDPEVAATRKNMGRVYEQLSKYDLALQEYSEALRISIASFGENHPQVARTRRNIQRLKRRSSE